MDKSKAELADAMGKVTPQIQKLLEGKPLASLEEADGALKTLATNVTSAMEKQIILLVSVSMMRMLVALYPKGLDGRVAPYVGQLTDSSARYLPKLLIPMIGGNSRLRIRELGIVLDFGQQDKWSTLSLEEACKFIVAISRNFGTILTAKLPGCVSQDSTAPPVKGKEAKAGKGGATAADAGSVTNLYQTELGAYCLPGSVAVKLPQLVEWLQDALNKSISDGALCQAVGISIKFDAATICDATADDSWELHGGEKVNGETLLTQLTGLVTSFPSIVILDQLIPGIAENPNSLALWNAFQDRQELREKVHLSGYLFPGCRKASITFRNVAVASDSFPQTSEDAATSSILQTVPGDGNAIHHWEAVGVLCFFGCIIRTHRFHGRPNSYVRRTFSAVCL